MRGKPFFPLFFVFLVLKESKRRNFYKNPQLLSFLLHLLHFSGLWIAALQSLKMLYMNLYSKRLAT